jgi:hypothetical protein
LPLGFNAERSLGQGHAGNRIGTTQPSELRGPLERSEFAPPSRSYRRVTRG